MRCSLGVVNDGNVVVVYSLVVCGDATILLSPLVFALLGVLFCFGV